MKTNNYNVIETMSETALDGEESAPIKFLLNNNTCVF